jgi:hypothetical protein
MRLGCSCHQAISQTGGSGSKATPIRTMPANHGKSNWELSTARALNVLHTLSDFGANERQFSVAGYADTRSVYANDTAEGRAYNTARRRDYSGRRSFLMLL